MPRTFKVTAHSSDEMRAAVLEFYATRVPADEASDRVLEATRTADGMQLALLFSRVETALANERYTRALERRTRSARWAFVLYLLASAAVGVRAAFLSPGTHAVDGVLSLVVFVVLLAGLIAYVYATSRAKARR